MAIVTINGEDYLSYQDLDGANLYLAADVLRAGTWDALSDDDKGRALVTATRLLQRQRWIGTVPTTDDPVDLIVAEATSLLAADIILKPAVGDGGGTGSNIKSVGGSGVPTVEFFKPVAGTPLPQAAFDLLRGLLVSGYTSTDPALDGTAYGSHNYQRSRFDPYDYGLWGNGSLPVDIDG